MHLRRLLMAPAAVAALGLASLGGCGSGGESGESSPAESVPRYRGETGVRIGRTAGEDAYLFGRVGGVARGAGGRLYVADVQANEIRVFDPSGRFLFRFGGEGEGPGELAGPCCPAFGPEGHLWVREGGNNRYSAFRISGDTVRFVRTVAMQHQAAGLWAPVTFDGSGRLVDVGIRTDDEGQPGRVRLHLEAGGSVDSVVRIPSPPPERIGQHRVVRETDGGRARLYLHQPFGPRHLIAHGPGGRWARAVSSTYRVIVHTPEGRVDTIARAGTTGPPLSDAERERGRRSLEEQGEWAGVSPGEMPFGIPERKPPLRALAYDSAGRLWVERSVPDGADRVADVYSADLELVGRHRWPADVPLGPEGWIAPRALIGVATDSLGVERVVGIRFSRQDGDGAEIPAPDSGGP